MALLKSGTRIYGNAIIDTNLSINGSTVSSSYDTGALVVKGGLGVAGNVFINANLNVKDTYIVDLDLRTNGIFYGKKSFLNLEITLFLNEEMDFKDPILKEKLKKIAKAIYSDNFKKNKYFDFTLSKKVKETL